MAASSSLDTRLELVHAGNLCQAPWTMAQMTTRTSASYHATNCRLVGYVVVVVVVVCNRGTVRMHVHQQKERP